VWNEERNVSETYGQTPVIATMRVIPVAGHDSMLLNLSGAHGPFFTRNVVLLTDTAGHTGVGEVPGGENIRRVLEQAKALVVGRPLAAYNEVLNAVRRGFAEYDREGSRPSICVRRSTR
jgi:glucarate dehydratase